VTTEFRVEEGFFAMRLTRFALFLAFMATCSVGRATITGGWWDDGSNGAIQCTAPPLTYDDDATTISGTQFSSPGYGIETVTTNSPFEPTLLLTTDINNDTTFPWTGYDVAVSMANTFTLSAANVIPPPNDWSVAPTTPPTWDSLTSQYVGYIDFTGGTPIPIGSNFQFSYTLSFSGNTYYAFTQAMMPVPEPSTIALLGAGLVGLIAWRWPRRGK
jgi:hypothetical protein